ncbi:hypothetical protein RB195_004912 [Necator americanus]|uniref:Uncharacterized protein n=1 Tax=Necator americanus TaxID=51031 RepID=A0ABR1BNV0_NECAM
MEKEDEESDEDDAFLNSSLEIINGLSRGIEVSHLTEQLKKPTNSYDSAATDSIFNTLKILSKSSLNNTLASLSPSPSSSPTPDKLTDSPDNCLALDDFASGDQNERSRLSFSPTKQIGTFALAEEEQLRSIEAVVPRLALEFSPTTSVHHSPLSTLREDLAAHDSPRLHSSLSEFSSHCHQCHIRRNSLNPSDFLYLFLFGLAILVFYLQSNGAAGPIHT